MRIAIYPGTFDPVTNGHIHIAERASKLYDEVIVAVAADNYKKTLFSLEERLYLLENSIGHIPNAKAETFSGLIVDYAKKKQAQALIRGLRAVSDFEYEMKVAAMNKYLSEDLETVFLMTYAEYSFLSSNLIKQVAVLGACIKGMVPPIVEKSLKEKYDSR